MKREDKSDLKSGLHTYFTNSKTNNARPKIVKLIMRGLNRRPTKVIHGAKSKWPTKVKGKHMKNNRSRYLPTLKYNLS